VTIPVNQSNSIVIATPPYTQLKKSKHGDDPNAVEAIYRAKDKWGWDPGAAGADDAVRVKAYVDMYFAKGRTTLS
jgi:hypothetical protein